MTPERRAHLSRIIATEKSAEDLQGIKTTIQREDGLSGWQQVVGEWTAKLAQLQRKEARR